MSALVMSCVSNISHKLPGRFAHSTDNLVLFTNQAIPV